MGNSQAYSENHHDDLQTLCAFVEGKLPAHQQGEIAEKALQSEALASKIEGIRYFFDGEKVDMEALEQFMNRANVQQEAIISQFVTKKKSTKRLYSFISIAATILILFGMGISFIFVRPPSQGIVEFTTNPYTFPSHEIRGDFTKKENAWIENYQEGDYPKVVSLLQEKDSLTQVELFALPLSMLYAEDYQQASIHFQQLLKTQSPNYVYIDQVRWFLALSYLKLNDKKAAKSILGVIKQEGREHYRYEEAMEILEMITHNAERG